MATGSEPSDRPEFAGFLLSLASAAMVHLGKAPDERGTLQVNLELARETIDILAMLEDKTDGNLTGEETKLLSGLLFQLRMECVEAEKTKG